MKFAKEIGDRPGEGQANGNLGNAYRSLGNYQKAIEYHEKDLKFAKELDDRAGEGRAYGNLGNAYHSLGNYHKAIEYHEKRLNLQKKSVIKPEKDEPMEISVMLTTHWVTIKKPLSMMKSFEICKRNR